jgi:hypothetical protein
VSAIRATVTTTITPVIGAIRWGRRRRMQTYLSAGGDVQPGTSFAEQQIQQPRASAAGVFRHYHRVAVLRPAAYMSVEDPSCAGTGRTGRN